MCCIALVRCVLVLRCGSAGWCGNLMQAAALVYMFLTLDIKGMNIRLISRSIHVPNHELEDTDTNTTPTKAVSRSIFVELLDIREESVILYLWGLNPLA